MENKILDEGSTVRGLEEHLPAIPESVGLKSHMPLCRGRSKKKAWS